jgi:2-polyprenyl-3-methyl-5-hydroxy-6-metoxy-1,4-benzoquinol methylase
LNNVGNNIKGMVCRIGVMIGSRPRSARIIVRVIMDAHVHLFPRRSCVNDKSNGYEAIAEHFIKARTQSIGPRVVRKWSKRLPPGAAVLDIGCGFGAPISEALLADGFAVYGVDASATLVSKFRERFPNTPVECGAVEDSLFFKRTFDAVVAWGLMFILPVETQRKLIGKVAAALKPGGQFLFTSTEEPCRWTDNLTGLESVSLGHDVYRRELTAHGFMLTGADKDEGENFYYFAMKA